MKQLDVDVSPPAIIKSFWLSLTHVTFDLDPGDLLPSRVMIFFLVLEFFSSDFWSSPRQTDRQKATPKSPSCISTGGLKNHPECIYERCSAGHLVGKNYCNTRKTIL